MFYLVQTLSQAYPDYDMTNVRMTNFRRGSKQQLMELVEARLLGAAKVWSDTPGSGEVDFFDCMWQAVDEVAELDHSEVFFYDDDLEDDRLGSPAAVWSFHAFIYSRRLKRMVYLGAQAVNKSAIVDEDSAELYGYDDVAGRLELDEDGEEVASPMLGLDEVPARGQKVV